MLTCHTGCLESIPGRFARSAALLGEKRGSRPITVLLTLVVERQPKNFDKKQAKMSKDVTKVIGTLKNVTMILIS